MVMLQASNDGTVTQTTPACGAMLQAATNGVVTKNPVPAPGLKLGHHDGTDAGGQRPSLGATLMKGRGRMSADPSLLADLLLPSA